MLPSCTERARYSSLLLVLGLVAVLLLICSSRFVESWRTDLVVGLSSSGTLGQVSSRLYRGFFVKSRFTERGHIETSDYYMYY